MIETDSAGVANTQEEAQNLEAQQLTAAVRALRHFVLYHNWQALTLAFFSSVAAAILWGFMYIFAYWFVLLSTTVSRGLNQKTLSEINDPQLVGSQFQWGFLAVAILSLVAAALVRRRVRFERLRDARLYFFWVVAELLMAVPNVTLSVWGNLSALVRLPKREAASAWLLLQRINDEGGRMSVSSLRLVVEDDQVLQRITFVLQIVGLIDVRERREGWFLCLQNRDAFALMSRAEAAA